MGRLELKHYMFINKLTFILREAIHKKGYPCFEYRKIMVKNKDIRAYIFFINI